MEEANAEREAANKESEAKAQKIRDLEEAYEDLNRRALEFGKKEKAYEEEAAAMKSTIEKLREDAEKAKRLSELEDAFNELKARASDFAEKEKKYQDEAEALKTTIETLKLSLDEEKESNQVVVEADVFMDSAVVSAEDGICSFVSEEFI